MFLNVFRCRGNLIPSHNRNDLRSYLRGFSGHFGQDQGPSNRNSNGNGCAGSSNKSTEERKRSNYHHLIMLDKRNQGNATEQSLLVQVQVLNAVVIPL